MSSSQAVNVQVVTVDEMRASAQAAVSALGVPWRQIMHFFDENGERIERWDNQELDQLEDAFYLLGETHLSTNRLAPVWLEDADVDDPFRSPEALKESLTTAAGAEALEWVTAELQKAGIVPDLYHPWTATISIRAGLGQVDIALGDERHAKPIVRIIQRGDCDTRDIGQVEQDVFAAVLTDELRWAQSLANPVTA